MAANVAGRRCSQQRGDKTFAAGAATAENRSGDARERFHSDVSPDPSVFDGSFSNNAWLQECPKPFTKQVWGNALHIAEKDAQALASSTAIDASDGGRRCSRRAGAGTARASCGHDCRDARLRPQRGRSLGNEVGFDINRLRHPTSPWATANVSISKTGGRQNLLLTQHFFQLEGEAKDLQPRFALGDLANPISV